MTDSPIDQDLEFIGSLTFDEVKQGLAWLAGFDPEKFQEFRTFIEKRRQSRSTWVERHS